MVAKVDFREASLNSVLDYLPKLAAQDSGGKTALNIVRLFPKESATRKKNHPPAHDCADCRACSNTLPQLGGVTVDYEKAAIVIKSQEAPKTAVQ